MASKSAQQEPEKAEVIEEALDVLDKLLDRVKVLYEQFFLGIQKQPPAHLHSDVERKLRDLAQLQIRNTALRYRFVTIQQKYGAYHTYWRRTLREIEAGRYHRNLSRITRQAAASGAEIPQEILAAMPKRMREQVRRDRDAQLARELRRRGEAAPDAGDLVRDTLVDDDGDGDADAGFVHESTDVREGALRAHVLDEADGDLDLEAFFRSVEAEELPLLPLSPAAAPPAAAATPAPPLADPALEEPAVIEAPRPAPAPALASDVRFPDFIAVRTPASVPPTRPSSPSLTSVPIAPSQQTRPNPIAPGSSSARPAVAPETMSGPFPREAPPREAPPRPTPPPVPSSTKPPPVPSPPKPPPVPSPPKPPPAPGASAESRPPPGMTDAEVRTLYARYVQAKQTIGQPPGPDSFGKLMKTIHAQAPKIMEQYRAKGVEFSVAVKDGQVIIRAKPRM